MCDKCDSLGSVIVLGLYYDLMFNAIDVNIFCIYLSVLIQSFQSKCVHFCCSRVLCICRIC